MPPNAKEVAAVLQSIDVSSLTVQQKYLPLTHPLEQQHQHQQHGDCQQQEEEEKHLSQDAEYEMADHVTDPTHPAQCYWDWESEDSSKEEKQRKMIAQILEEEEIRQMLAVESIERNLVSRSKSEGNFVTCTGAGGNEDYWNMPANEEDEALVSSSLCTYRMVESLLEEAVSLKERENTVEYVYAPHVCDETHPVNSYWDEAECHASEEEKRQSLIQTILQEEQCRMAVELGLVEQRLLKDASLRRNDPAYAGPVSAECEEYWLWESAPPRVVEASHVGDDSHPCNAYWDWKTLTVLELKDKMISEIMEEEKIRVMLSIEHVEDTLREEQQRHEGTEVAETTNKGGTSEGESYWDW